jgi:hypothetical protein
MDENNIVGNISDEGMVGEEQPGSVAGLPALRPRICFECGYSTESLTLPCPCPECGKLISETVPQIATKAYTLLTLLIGHLWPWVFAACGELGVYLRALVFESRADYRPIILISAVLTMFNGCIMMMRFGDRPLVVRDASSLLSMRRTSVHRRIWLSRGIHLVLIFGLPFVLAKIMMVLLI